MVNVLLLGAGFSRNWGGWLASEVRNRIGLRLAGHPDLQAVLNQFSNFEDALQHFQNEFDRSPNANNVVHRLIAFQDAIAATFDAMNKSMSRRAFEFSNDIAFSVGSYLTRFDAIFSLNQDLLLERHYATPRTNVLALSGTKLAGCELPGMHPQQSPDYHGEEEALHTRWHPKEPFSVTPNFQPLFKLHGSTNWFSSTGEPLMVMGGDKSRTITRHKILTWYGMEFERYLSMPGAKLTVIGYGFMDRHINQTICHAWKASKFPMMIVSPDGRDVVKKANGSFGGQIPGPPGPLEDIERYDSTRSLSATFGGDDSAEHDNLTLFMKPG